MVKRCCIGKTETAHMGLGDSQCGDIRGGEEAAKDPKKGAGRRHTAVAKAGTDEGHARQSTEAQTCSGNRTQARRLRERWPRAVYCFLALHDLSEKT